MPNTPKYRFSRGEEGYVTFDSNGYVIDAKGFGRLMWSCNPNVDNELVGKHVDELAEMLEKNGTSRNVYLEFEAEVHVGLLKKMLQNAKH